MACPLVSPPKGLMLGVLNLSQGQSALNHLDILASSSVNGDMDESDSYGVMTEMIIEHRAILGRRFIIFPQLRLYWNPQAHGDRRSNIPDIGLGRLLPDGTRCLQGGAEQKAGIEAMRNFPDPVDIVNDPTLRAAMHEATLQASDQVKAAIKNGALPHDVPVKWIVAVGPYFTIRQFGPFNEADLITRGHRVN